MRIAIAGDLHGNWDFLNKIEADLILLTGDAGFIFPECKKENHLRIPKKHPDIGNLFEYRDGKKKILTDTIMIAGNHDCFLCLERYNIPNLFYLRNGEVTTYLLKEKGKGTKINIAGVGGCYGPKDYEKDWGLLSGHNKRHFTKAQIEKCEKQKKIGNIDILLTHDCPEGLLPDAGYGCGHLTELIKTLQPNYAFCGHYHRYAESKIGRTNIYALPREEEGYYELYSLEKGKGKFRKLT